MEFRSKYLCLLDELEQFNKVYDAIQLLHEHDIFDCDEYLVHKSIATDKLYKMAKQVLKEEEDGER